MIQITLLVPLQSLQLAFPFLDLKLNRARVILAKLLNLELSSDLLNLLKYLRSLPLIQAYIYQTDLTMAG